MAFLPASITWPNPLTNPFQPDYSNTAARRSRSPTRDRENTTYRDQRSPANNYDRSDRRPSRSEQPAGNMEDRQNSQQDRRVYVGNLAYDVKWHHLKDHMREGTKTPIPITFPHYQLLTILTAGQVLYADVLELPNGMSKGCGIVEYATKDEAQNAINTLSNRSLMGRLIYVREVSSLTLRLPPRMPLTQFTGPRDRAALQLWRWRPWWHGWRTPRQLRSRTWLWRPWRLRRWIRRWTWHGWPHPDLRLQRESSSAQ